MLHVLVHGAVPGELRLCGSQFQVEVVDGERDDDDEAEDEAQNEWQGFLQLFPLVSNAFKGFTEHEVLVDVEGLYLDVAHVHGYALLVVGGDER